MKEFGNAKRASPIHLKTTPKVGAVFPRLNRPGASSPASVLMPVLQELLKVPSDLFLPIIDGDFKPPDRV
jgi:hypothetical protein